MKKKASRKDEMMEIDWRNDMLFFPTDEEPGNKKLEKRIHEEYKQGGVAFRCEQCKRSGVFNHTCAFAHEWNVDMGNMGEEVILQNCAICAIENHEQKKRWEEECKLGGIPFRCRNCGKEGVIHHDTEFALSWNKHYKGRGALVEDCPNCETTRSGQKETVAAERKGIRKGQTKVSSNRDGKDENGTGATEMGEGVPQLRRTVMRSFAII